MSEFRSIYFILPNIAIVSILVAFICGLLRIKYLYKNLFVVFVLIFIAVLTEIISHMMVYYLKMSNLELYNIYVLFEATLIAVFYYQYLEKKNIKSMIIFIGFSVIVTISIELIFQPKNTMREVSLCFESLFIVILSILSFHQILQKQVYTNVLDSSIFWVNSAFLIYFSGNLFIYLFSNFLHEYYQKAFMEIWAFHSVLSLILYTLISIGFWKTKPLQISN